MINFLKFLDSISKNKKYEFLLILFLNLYVVFSEIVLVYIFSLLVKSEGINDLIFLVCT